MSALLAGPGVVEGCGVDRAGRRALFLDRDGVINVNLGYVHTPDRTQWVDGIFALCAQAQARGYALLIATNQAGIARGYYDVAAFEVYTRWMHAQFAERGIQIAATLFCPHHPSAGQGAFTGPCGCRKPAPGMFLTAAQRYAIDLSSSGLVGDKISDMQAGHAAGLSHLHLLGGEVGSGTLPAAVLCVPELGAVRLPA